MGWARGGGRFLGYAVLYLMGETDLGCTFGRYCHSVLTYIGFDIGSTSSEDVVNPKKHILIATVLVCLITGALASIEVYAAQMVWPVTGIHRTLIPLLCMLAGGLVFSYELGAEMLNFGAFIAFMGVNLSAFVHYSFRTKDCSWTAGLPPSSGLVIACTFG